MVKWGSTFEPPSNGLYRVATNRSSDPSPYKRSRLDATDQGNFTVMVDSDRTLIWNNVSAMFERWVSFDIFLSCLYPEDKVILWDGPQEYHRLCFKCDKPIFPVDTRGSKDEKPDPNIQYVLQSNDAADLRTGGHYGCTFIDDMGRSEISVLICDYCLRKYGDRVLWFDTPHKGKPYNYRTEAENGERYAQFIKEEIRLMEEAGFEWRNYTEDFQIPRNLNEIDSNNCGWYLKDWQPCFEITVYDDGSKGCVKDSHQRWAWLDTHPALARALEDLRQRIFYPNETPEFLANDRLDDAMHRMRCSTVEELNALHERIAMYLNDSMGDSIDHEATKKANEEQGKGK